MKLIDAAEKFKFHCKFERNLDKNTLRAYTIDLQQFIEKFSTLKISQIDKFLIKEHIEYLYNLNYKIKTIKRKVAIIKAFFNYLEFDELIENTPFNKLKLSIKEPKILPETMELREIETILNYLHKNRNKTDNNTFKYKTLTKDLLVAEILFATGIRVSELSNLKRKDINLKSGLIKIFGKGSKERIIQICDKEVLGLIKEYLQLFKLGPNDYFLINKLGKRLSEQSIRLTIHKYMKKIGLTKHITPHIFRHSFATLLLEEGVDIRYIQNMLGHSSISTTQIYTQVSMKHQKKLLKTKHPRRNLKFVS